MMKFGTTLSKITYDDILEEYAFFIRSHKGEFIAYYSMPLGVAIVHKMPHGAQPHTSSVISALRVPKEVLEAIGDETQWVFMQDDILPQARLV